MNDPPWIEIGLHPDGQSVRVSARTADGAPAGHPLGAGLSQDDLLAFAELVGKKAERQIEVDAEIEKRAGALYTGVLASEVGAAFSAIEAKQDGASLLVRIATDDVALASIPWEAMRNNDGFLASSARHVITRVPRSFRSLPAREVSGPLRILPVAPTSIPSALATLTEALQPAIAAGTVVLLRPIADVSGGIEGFLSALRRRCQDEPHVLHFFGHGSVTPGKPPALVVTSGSEGHLSADLFAAELADGFRALRLVVLEACEMGQASHFASAAEHIARAGPQAVVAFLWPVLADVARTFSQQLYETLTDPTGANGDIGRSVHRARRTLLATGAAGLSPVLYLNGTSPTIFNLRQTRAAAPQPASPAPAGMPAGAGPAGMPAALGQLLARKRGWSLVLGDRGEEESGASAMREALAKFFVSNGDSRAAHLPVKPLMQRYALLQSDKKLVSLAQAALQERIQAALDSTRDPVPAHVHALATSMSPGAHVTFLWLPLLERALSKAWPKRKIYSVQMVSGERDAAPDVFIRDPGTGKWTLDTDDLPDEIDPDDFAILRISGGFSLQGGFTSPTLTDDDHVRGLIAAPSYRPDWAQAILGELRSRPTLLCGIDVLDWHHRMALRWLYERGLPRGSFAALPPGTDSVEQEIWNKGASLSESDPVATAMLGPEDLTALLGGRGGPG